MDGYDDFETEMLASGWNLDKIERVWQQHLLDTANESDYNTANESDYYSYSNDQD